MSTKELISRKDASLCVAAAAARYTNFSPHDAVIFLKYSNYTGNPRLTRLIGFTIFRTYVFSKSVLRVETRVDFT